MDQWDVLLQQVINGVSLGAMDEPSMGLAPALVEQVFEIIQAINKQGTSIFVVEQNANMDSHTRYDRPATAPSDRRFALGVRPVPRAVRHFAASSGG